MSRSELHYSCQYFDQTDVCCGGCGGGCVVSPVTIITPHHYHQVHPQSLGWLTVQIFLSIPLYLLFVVSTSTLQKAALIWRLRLPQPANKSLPLEDAVLWDYLYYNEVWFVVGGKSFRCSAALYWHDSCVDQLCWVTWDNDTMTHYAGSDLFSCSGNIFTDTRKMIN